MTPREAAAARDLIARARLEKDKPAKPEPPVAPTEQEVWRDEQRGPVSYERCPVHGQLVLFDGAGRMLGVCDGCAMDAADGLRNLIGVR